MTVAEPRAAAATGRCLGAGVLATILLGACGLPFSSTLPRPSLDCQHEDVPGVLSFCGSSTQAPFLGYEIYYTIRTANEPQPSNPLHHEELRARFGRLSPAGTESCGTDRLPLVRAADAGTNHTVFLDVTAFRIADTADTEPFLRLSWRSGDRVPVRRGVAADEFSPCRLFSAVDGYQREDRDISPAAADAIDEAAGDVIYLYAYAVSYGLDRSQRLYSAPLAIDRVELALPFR